MALSRRLVSSWNLVDTTRFEIWRIRTLEHGHDKRGMSKSPTLFIGPSQTPTPITFRSSSQPSSMSVELTKDKDGFITPSEYTNAFTIFGISQSNSIKTSYPAFVRCGA